MSVFVDAAASSSRARPGTAGGQAEPRVDGASGPGSPEPVEGPGRLKLKEAAKQFEAILLRQMLTAARKTDFGDGLFSSEAMGTFRQMQDDRTADVIADTGCLGLATIIEAQLARYLPPEG